LTAGTAFRLLFTRSPFTRCSQQPFVQISRNVPEYATYVAHPLQDQSAHATTSSFRPSKLGARLHAHVRCRPGSCAPTAASAMATKAAAVFRSKPLGHQGAVCEDAHGKATASSEFDGSSAAVTQFDDWRDSGMFSAFYPSPNASERHATPQTGLVFLHGVGLGILPYLPFIWKLLNVFGKDTPIIIPQVWARI
jgi:hypothetical protein